MAKHGRLVNIPKWSKRVPNCQKHLGLPFWTFLDPIGPLWNVDKPAMFGHFCLICWCVFFWDTMYIGHVLILAMSTFFY